MIIGSVLPELLLALALLFRVGLAGPPLLDVRGGDGPRGTQDGGARKASSQRKAALSSLG